MAVTVGWVQGGAVCADGGGGRSSASTANDYGGPVGGTRLAAGSSAGRVKALGVVEQRRRGLGQSWWPYDGWGRAVQSLGKSDPVFCGMPRVESYGQRQQACENAAGTTLGPRRLRRRQVRAQRDARPAPASSSCCHEPWARYNTHIHAYTRT